MAGSKSQSHLLGGVVELQAHSPVAYPQTYLRILAGDCARLRDAQEDIHSGWGEILVVGYISTHSSAVCRSVLQVAMQVQYCTPRYRLGIQGNKGVEKRGPSPLARGILGSLVWVDRRRTEEVKSGGMLVGCCCEC